ncbi:MAG: dienelactone hydrolase family protein, partial [Chloroflexi bacterium]|nr:dienelactone hydrolase family protein [Chloroflexota bacterium]
SGYLARPDDGLPHPGVIVIQEWWGLDGHIKSVADRFAAAGYIALAPDLYHGKMASEPDEARKLVMELDRDRAVMELDASASFLLANGAAGPKVGITGECMGGGLSILTAARSAKIGASVIFYGGNPPLNLIFGVQCPVLGLYGAADAGIPAARVHELAGAMMAAGKSFEFQIYPGDVPHSFFNEERASYRKEASDDAWQRTLAFFATNLGEK